MEGDPLGVRAVLCDLGGVVIRIDPDRIRRAWATRSAMPAEQVHAAYPDEVYEAFERDEVSEEDYLAHVRERLRLHGTDEELVDCFNQLYLGVDRDVVALLGERRARGAWLGGLTNTNRTHHRVWSRRFADALDVFHAIDCSYEMGARKPEPEAFLRVLATHDLEPHETVFVDDVDDHVQAAERVGLHALRFTDAATLADHLASIPWQS